MEQAVNSFDGGMVLDFNPLQTSNEVLTKALNATLVTMNGNERVLQNDWGNARVESAFLPAGYVPVGVKEHGGIIYVASHNPLTNRSQIGSFPSPERNLGDISTDDDITFGDNDTNKDILYEAELLFDGAVIHPGDKFSLTFKEKEDGEDGEEEENGLDLEQCISNWDNVIDEGSIHKAYSPQNSIFTYKLFIEDSGNNLIDITDKLKRYETIEMDNASYTKEITEWPDNVSVEYKFNKGYFIKKAKINDSEQEEQSDTKQRELMEYRLKTSNYNTYNSKISGKMFLVRQTNSIDHISVNVKGVKTDNNTKLKLIFYITYYYNCPDKSPYINNERGIDSNKNLGWVVPAGNQYPYYDSTTNLYKYTIQYTISGIPLNGDTLSGVQGDPNQEYADVSLTTPITINKSSYNNREKYIPNDDSSPYYVDYDGYYESEDSDDYDEKYNFGIIEGCKLELKNKLKNGQSTPILEYSITPYIGYNDPNNTLDEIALTNLRVEGSLDISLIGSNTLDLNYWQYKWQDSRLTLRTGFKDYLDDDENNKLTKIRIYYKPIDPDNIPQIPQFNINDDRDSCPKLEISNINEISDRTDEIAGLDSNYIYKCWIYGVFSGGGERNFGESYFLTCDLHNSLYNSYYKNYYSDRSTLRSDLKLDMTAILDINQTTDIISFEPSILKKLSNEDEDYNDYVIGKIGEVSGNEYWEWKRIGNLKNKDYNIIPKNKESYPYNSFKSKTKQVENGKLNLIKIIEIIFNLLVKKIRIKCSKLSLYYFGVDPISIDIGTSSTSAYFSFNRNWNSPGNEPYQVNNLDQGTPRYLNDLTLNTSDNPITQALNLEGINIDYTNILDEHDQIIGQTINTSTNKDTSLSLDIDSYPFIIIHPFNSYLGWSGTESEKTYSYASRKVQRQNPSSGVTSTNNWIGLLIAYNNFSQYAYMPFVSFREQEFQTYQEVLKKYFKTIFGSDSIYYPESNYLHENSVKVRSIKNIYDFSSTNIDIQQGDYYDDDLISDAPQDIIDFKYTSSESIIQNLNIDDDSIYTTFIDKINRWISEEIGYDIDGIFYGESSMTIPESCFILNDNLTIQNISGLKYVNEKLIASSVSSSSNRIRLGHVEGDDTVVLIGENLPFININNNNQLVYGDND